MADDFSVDAIETYDDDEVFTASTDDFDDDTDAVDADPDQDGIAALSREVGVDFSGFSDLKSAEAAHRLLMDQYAQAGFRAQPAPQPAPQALGDPMDADFEDEEEESVDEEDAAEPKKRTRKTKREKALEREVARMKQAEKQRQQQQYEADQRDRVARAVRAIDALKSDTFGHDDKARSYEQIQAAQALYNHAEQIQAGAAQFGRQMTIEQAIAAAAKVRGVKPAAKKPSAEDAPVSARRGKVSNTGRAVSLGGPALDPFGLTADPFFKAGVAKLASRKR